MAYQNRELIKSLFVVLLVILNFNFSLQQESCSLPNGKGQSTCIRLHLCETLQSTIVKYGGRPPPDVAQDIRAHACTNKAFVCCPDNAVTTTVAPPTTSSQAVTPLSQQLGSLPEDPVNLNTIKSHPNFNLINEKSCGVLTANRIVGGDNAGLREFPWAALLGYQLLDSFRWQCGGSLISKRFVLTAAHCINRELATVRLGEHTISTEKDCDEYKFCTDPVQDIRIEKKTRHPRYKSKPPTNDIAILKLVSDADTSKNNVKTICLPNSVENSLDAVKDKIFLITGWGKVETGQESDILQKASVPFVENSECTRRFSPYNIPVFKTYLCAGGHNKTDTCKGDSGGGIIAFAQINARPRMILYGVVSGGIACLRADLVFPGIYTDIQYYYDWILDNMS